MPILVEAIAQNTGQTCSAGSRLLVEQCTFDTVLGRVAEAFAKVRVGTAAMFLNLGPVVKPAQLPRVTCCLDAVRAGGAPILIQGQIPYGVPPNS